ncbi:MAG: thiamine-phosphate kinase [Bacteroidota bacterium]|nr:thiamine-phosphate kinase [Bacteroidota bacterium]
MSKKESAENVQDLGEFGLIKKLTADIVSCQTSTRKGIGDDAAVLDHGNNETVVTTDMLLEGVHFDLTYFPLKHLGYKAVTVNLSDLFAMNAIPQQITVSIGISAKFSISSIEELYKGIKLACKQYDVDLVGGDTCASMNGLVISITAIGMCAPGSAIFRAGAKANDLICVSGDLGGAYMGLLVLQREMELFNKDTSQQPKLNEYQYILEKQLKPEARQDIISDLRQKEIKPSSMIDISDGLSSDLLHLCDSSGLGCKIFASKIPINRETENLAIEMGLSPLVAALNGGEDYELLFTLNLEYFDSIQNMDQISVIGHMVNVTEGTNMILDDDTSVPLLAQGWKAENAM